MLWNVVRQIGVVRIVLAFCLSLSLIYSWVVHTYCQELEAQLVLASSLSERQGTMLSSMATKTKQNEQTIEALNTQLKQQQKNNSVVVKKMLSVKKPASCVEAMTYLKDNAATADWK